MAYLNNVRDGRQSKVYLLTFGSTAITTLVKGHVYVYAQKDGTSPALPNIAAGHLFVFNQASNPSQGTNDVIYEVTPKFLGGATDKDLSFEKSTQEVTCDKDDAQNIVSPGTVAISGSVTAFDLLQDSTSSAANLIRQRFNDMITYDANGDPITNRLDRTEKDFLMFVWDTRDLNSGEYIAIDFVPAFLTSQGHGSSYGSGQTFSVNFAGADTDQAGHKRSYQQFAYFSEFVAQLESWT